MDRVEHLDDLSQPESSQVRGGRRLIQIVEQSGNMTRFLNQVLALKTFIRIDDEAEAVSSFRAGFDG